MLPSLREDLKDSYIAVLFTNTSAEDMDAIDADIQKEPGVKRGKKFGSAIKGFSFKLPATASPVAKQRILEKLMRKGQVDYVFPDFELKAAGVAGRCHDGG